MVSLPDFQKVERWQHPLLRQRLDSTNVNGPAHRLHGTRGEVALFHPMRVLALSAVGLSQAWADDAASGVALPSEAVVTEAPHTAKAGAAEPAAPEAASGVTLPSEAVVDAAAKAQRKAAVADAPGLNVSSRGIAYSRGTIDAEVLAKLIESKLKTIAGYAMEDASDAASEFAPDVTAWFVTKIVQYVIDERNVDGLDVAIADAAIPVFVTALAASKLDVQSKFGQLSPADASLLAMDIVWARLREDADLRRKFKVEKDPSDTFCSSKPRGFEQRTKLLAETKFDRWRNDYGPEKPSFTSLCVSAGENLNKLESTEKNLSTVLEMVTNWKSTPASEKINAVLQLLTDPDLRSFLVHPNFGGDTATEYGQTAVDRQRTGLKADERKEIRKTGILDAVLAALSSAIRADRDTGSVEVHLDDLAAEISRTWYRKEGFSPYLSIGSGYMYHFTDALDTPNSSPFLAEKIGVVYRRPLTDPAFARTRSGSSHSFHAGIYGSGLLYSLTLGKDDKAPFLLGGGFLGLTVYGAVDLNLGIGAIMPLHPDETHRPDGQVTVSIEVPLHEYIDALAKRK